MKVLSGDLKGRQIEVRLDRSFRPTSDKLRQAVFDYLRHRKRGGSFLDLFAGSCAMSFEALSNGMNLAVAVEADRNRCRMAGRTFQTLGLPQSSFKIVQSNVADSFHRITSIHKPFDVVFADPPYEDGFDQNLISEMHTNGILDDSSIFILETSVSRQKEFSDSACSIRPQDIKRYGDSVILVY